MPGASLAASVLIPSFGRPGQLAECLRSLAAQTLPPAEVIVVWQGDDTATRDAALAFESVLPCRLMVLHNPVRGVVPAENLALERASGEIVLLIDDDARAPANWVARHLAYYRDPAVGAVGGPADNFRLDGAPFPRRAQRPVGQLTRYGKVIGNMYDQAVEWQTLPPLDVHHLVGYNLSLRRSAFGKFETGLKPYWQLFELDACLQVSKSGRRVIFDFANVVEHVPTNTAYVGGRDGDLTIKVFNNAYNHAFVLSKHSPRHLRLLRILYLLLMGSVANPGVLGFIVALGRYRNPKREFGILLRTWKNHLAGWQAGRPTASGLVRDHTRTMETSGRES